MGTLKFENSKDADRVVVIMNKVLAAIEENECTYKEVMLVLDAVRNNYMKKGFNLLEETNIQEVAKYGGLLKKKREV